MEHGTAAQFGDDGQLIGTYEMVHGTGLDLWRGWSSSDGTTNLTEARRWVDGSPDGLERWINEDQVSVYEERRFKKHVGLHGIERCWDDTELTPGYPRFHLEGEMVSRAAYEKATAETELRYKPEDDLPWRKFPKEIRKHLRVPYSMSQSVEFELDGVRRSGCIKVGKPYAVSAGEARCPVSVAGLHEDLADVSGADTLQALLLALRLVEELLRTYVERGGRVLIPGPGDEDAEWSLDTYFGARPER